MGVIDRTSSTSRFHLPSGTRRFGPGIAAYRVGRLPLVVRVVPWVLLVLAVAAGVVAVGLSAIRPSTGVPFAAGFGLIAILLLGSSAALFIYRVITSRGRWG